MQKQTEALAVNSVESDPQSLAIRQFCIDALAFSVPQFRSREQAAGVVSEWFPGDMLALASLHKRITQNKPLLAA